MGTCQNTYYGPLTVTSANGTLTMTMGRPASPSSFVLTHFDGDTLTFDTIGENASGKSGATPGIGADGTAATVNLAFCDRTGLGTFIR